MVGFLLGLCGECVVNLNTAQRAECVQRAISIITEKTCVSLERILQHPHRVRYWVLLTDSCTSGLSKCGNSTSGSGVDCIRVLDGCDELVMRHLKCPDASEMQGTSLSPSKNCDAVSSYLKFSAQELVPWDTVTDLTLRVSALSDLSTPYDEDDTSAPSSSSAAARRTTYRQRHLASAKRRRLQCGLDISNLSRSLAEDINESDSTWMLLGASMIAEQLSSSFTRTFSDVISASLPSIAVVTTTTATAAAAAETTTTAATTTVAETTTTAATTTVAETATTETAAETATETAAETAAAASEFEPLRGTIYQFPRVYSADYLWELFYPHMLILLRTPALAASEGLSLMGHLGE